MAELETANLLVTGYRDSSLRMSLSLHSKCHRSKSDILPEAHGF